MTQHNRRVTADDDDHSSLPLNTKHAISPYFTDGNNHTHRKKTVQVASYSKDLSSYVFNKRLSTGKLICLNRNLGKCAASESLSQATWIDAATALYVLDKLFKFRWHHKDMRGCGQKTCGLKFLKVDTHFLVWWAQRVVTMLCQQMLSQTT